MGSTLSGAVIFALGTIAVASFILSDRVEQLKNGTPASVLLLTILSFINQKCSSHEPDTIM